MAVPHELLAAAWGPGACSLACTPWANRISVDWTCHSDRAFRQAHLHEDIFGALMGISKLTESTTKGTFHPWSAKFLLPSGCKETILRFIHVAPDC